MTSPANTGGATPAPPRRVRTILRTAAGLPKDFTRGDGDARMAECWIARNLLARSRSRGPIGRLVIDLRPYAERGDVDRTLARLERGLAALEQRGLRLTLRSEGDRVFIEPAETQMELLDLLDGAA
jgi:hypothetical protein